MINSGFIAPLAVVTIQEGIKTRLVPLLLALLLLGVILASFAGSLGVTEVAQIQCTILASYLRFIGVLVLCLFVLNTQIREFNDKGLELVLALPIPRSHYFFGRLAGYGVLAFLVAGLFFTTLLFYAPWHQSALWGVSLFFELLIIIAFSLLSVFSFRQLPPAFITVFAFYLLSRALTSLILVGQGPIMPKFVVVNWLINSLMEGLAFVLPALDRFTQPQWLIYGTGTFSDLAFVVGQGVIYLALLSAAALVDFYRKNL
jgi:hypothetical protein